MESFPEAARGRSFDVLTMERLQCLSFLCRGTRKEVYRVLIFSGEFSAICRSLVFLLMVRYKQSFVKSELTDNDSF
jgi:hypothetical protein